MFSLFSLICIVQSTFYGDVTVMWSGAARGNGLTQCTLNPLEDIQFLLYTRSNPDEGFRLFSDDDKTLNRSHFRFDKPLAVFMHGFTESATLPNRSSQEVKNAFLSAGDYNVILVDWTPIVTFPWYREAVANIPAASQYIAKFLQYLIKRGYSADRVHLIGFSLGGQAVGQVGRELKKLGTLVPRITALDPAGPLFTGNDNSRLRPEDAKFVDVIHTDGGLQGYKGPLGHADFFPNGGKALQPECFKESVNRPVSSGGFFLAKWLQNSSLTVTCSHQRAWRYFVESIKSPKAFQATRCEPSEKFPICESLNGTAFMGMGADSRLRGNFYLQTNGLPPYGRNITV